MRQEVMLAKFQPHASKMHLKWAEIRYCAQYAVYSNNYSEQNCAEQLAFYFIFFSFDELYPGTMDFQFFAPMVFRYLLV